MLINVTKKKDLNQLEKLVNKCDEIKTVSKRRAIWVYIINRRDKYYFVNLNIINCFNLPSDLKFVDKKQDELRQPILDEQKAESDKRDAVHLKSLMDFCNTIKGGYNNENKFIR